MEKIKEYIEKYDTIIIHGHIRPDGDCIGTQYGLYYLIKDNYPHKKVYITGETSEFISFIGRPALVDESLFQDALSICVDYFPPAKIIPFQKNNFTPCNYQDIRNMDITISPKECHLLWDNLSSMIHSESDSLEKLYIQYQREAYFLFSSTGIEGYSVRTIFSPGIETKSNPGCFYCISPKILPFTGTSIMKNLGFSHETLPMASSITNGGREVS